MAIHNTSEDSANPAEDGKPAAKIVPDSGDVWSRVAGSLKGNLWIAPDFDQLPDDMAEALGML